MATFSSIQRLLLLVIITKQVSTHPLKEDYGLFYSILNSMKEELGNGSILERKVRQVLPDPEAKWPNAIIPYKLQENVFSEKMINLLKESIDEIQQNTCIRFIPHTTEEDYLDIFHHENLCAAKIGRAHGKQTLILSEAGCYTKGFLMHQLVHVVGFADEHVRPDRDSFLLIFKSNIIPGKEHTFKKWNSSDLATPFIFSYDSIMLYPEYFLSKDPQKYKTMVAKKPDIILPVPYYVEALPQVDIRRMNTYYHCPRREWDDWEEEEADEECIL